MRELRILTATAVAYLLGTTARHLDRAAAAVEDLVLR
jgi:hypothetical protein